MARPRTPIGTYGRIKVTELGPKVFEASARFRMRNGRSRRVRRRGSSRTAAENKLKEAMRPLADQVAGKNINGDTGFDHVMDLWLADFQKKVELGKRAHKSYQEYAGVIRQLKPMMGDLACREAENAGLCDEVLKDIRAESAKSNRGKTGTAAMKRARTVLSHVCAYAVRHGAMATNPVKSVEQIDGDDNEVLALEPEQRADFLAKLRAFVDAKVTEPGNRLGVRARAWTDLPELAEGMLATGTRIGEVLALIGEGIDPAARLVTADHHLVRIPGVGMVRVPKRKGGRKGLTLAVPEWSLPLWRRRKLESGGGALWPAWNGGWEDPGNVARRLAEACNAIGYGWVSSRMFRHTTATHLGDKDVASTAIADQLGNTPAVVEKNYRRKRVANQAVAAHLEDLLDRPVTES